MKARDIRIPALGGHTIPATLLKTKGHSERMCILAHGIFVTRSENGRFDRLAERLSTIGISTIRIDLSGHGKSDIASRDTTVAGMADDIAYTHQYLRKLALREIDIVASSFSGALLSLLCGNRHGPRFARVVFLNPVLDFKNAFVEAEMPEMASMFSATNLETAFRTGQFSPVPHFQMSRAFILELMTVDVQRAYQSFDTPHLVVHGTADELISYEHTRRIAESNSHATWKAIAGAKHAFNTHQAEMEAYGATCEWLSA